jgi:hypothetical protein
LVKVSVRGNHHHGMRLVQPLRQIQAATTKATLACSKGIG